MKKVVLILFLAFVTVSCSKEQIKKLEGKVDVSVVLKDSDDTPLKNWVIYAYSQWAWEHKSNSRPTFYAKQLATDANGKAYFTLEVDRFDEREVYRFVVYYTVDNNGKTNLSGNELPRDYSQKVLAVTLKSENNGVIEMKL